MRECLMTGIHKSQEMILEYLLDHREGATADDLAEHLKISKSGTKEHINKLESLGYLAFEDQRGTVGRPRRVYRLSPAGREVFPRQYSWLSNTLLEHLTENMGAAAVSKIMAELAANVSRSMNDRFQRAASTAELLEEITKALNELGYRARLTQKDLRKGAVIEATNCVYHSVAQSHPELCKFDISFIEKSSGNMSVKLESCIARGGSVCRFCIKKPRG